MALKVVSATPQPKLKVVSNPGGMQGSTYNPQPAAPVQYVQNATPPKPLQAAPLATPLQGGYAHTVQPAATAQQIAQAAETQRIAVAREVARQKEAKRAEVQGQVNNRVAANESALKLKVSTAKFQGQIRVGRNYAPGSVTVPKYVSDDPEYDKIKEEAKRQAMKLVDNLKQSDAKGFDKFVDKVTFGADRRASGARKFAEKQANDVADRQVKVYEKKIDAYTKLQASLQADYEAKKLKLSAAELNALADEYNAKMQAGLNDLKRVEAYTIGTVEGYGLKAEEKIKSKPLQAAGFINRNVVQRAGQNPLWKYTLGGGSENIPSIVTAPSRAVNWIGNINTNTRQVYKYGGGAEERIKTGKNAWQSTFNQRNFNIRPWTDKKFDAKEIEKRFGKEAEQKANSYKKLDESNYEQVDAWGRKTGKHGLKDKKLADKEYWKQMLYEDYNRQHRFRNSLLELGADPLLVAGPATKAAKGSKAAETLSEIGRASKATSWAFKAADVVSEAKGAFKAKLGENRLVAWLGKEAKNPEEELADAIAAAKKTQGAAQDQIIDRVNHINKKLAAGEKLDVSVFDDLASLTDSEAKIIQRMKAGKLTARDRLWLVGKNNAPIREKLEGIATKWEDFSEKMRSADNVQNTRFGKGKQTYSPRTSWIKDEEGLSKYNFKRFKKRVITQSKEDFRQGAIDRYFKSSLDDKFAAGQNTKRARQLAEREQLLKRYDDAVVPAREAVEKAYKRTKSPINKIRKVVGTPTRVWKKSVLKYRPAWTVNNVAYNTQAGFLAGGAGYGVEQAKMLNPRYVRKAMDEIPAEVRTNLAKEIGGKGKLNKFYAGVENNPRVAAFRALKKKGLSDAEALKRVDKYFFNYTTKNWERPIKTVVPFLQWQKNLTKAAVNMSLDRPAAAIAYNRTGRYQDQAFEKDFNTMIPKLKELGYSDEEISAFRKEQAKYYAGRLKVGSKYINTPFNAFSEKGLTSMGLNPYIAAAGETADAVDSFGRPVSGNEASFLRRLTTKFPQAELGYKRYKGWRVDKGFDKPSVKYIGKSGSESYGMTKEKQGYDTTKPNYVASMDPRTKTKQDLSAFLGKPRDTEFDKEKFVEGKKLQKVTAEYFSKSTGWKDMDFDKSQAEQDALFKKYGMTPDDFFKGVLAKYDSDHTKKIKGMKESAAAKNKSLFEEYAKQPAGTRNVWATEKLRELTASGYFDDNPFLKSFKWVNKDTAFKADKQKAVQYALPSESRKLAGASKKQLAYQKAKSTGDWTAYRKSYKTKESPYQVNGKHFKSAESMDKSREGQFWHEYAQASKAERKVLLAKHPEFNKRANWTDKQWDEWKIEDRAKKLAKLKGWNNTDKIYDRVIAQNRSSAAKFKSAQTYRRGSKKRIAYV